MKKGFINLAAKPVKFVATVAISIGLCSSFANGVIHPVIDAPITNYITDFIYENCQDITAANVADELPTLIKISAALVGINVEEVLSDASNSGEAIVDAIVAHFTTPVLNVVSIVISFVLLYIISGILISFAIWILNSIFKTGLFGLLNKVFGVFFGIACSMITGWILVAVLEFLFNLPTLQSVELIDSFEGNFLYEFYKNYNPIELLLSF